jgi:hypothetical protein
VFKTTARAVTGLVATFAIAAGAVAIAAGAVAVPAASAAPAPSCSGPIDYVDITDYPGKRIEAYYYVSGCTRVVTYVARKNGGQTVWSVEGVQVDGFPYGGP